MLSCFAKASLYFFPQIIFSSAAYYLKISALLNQGDANFLKYCLRTLNPTNIFLFLSQRSKETAPEVGVSHSLLCQGQEIISSISKYQFPFSASVPLRELSSPMTYIPTTWDSHCHSLSVRASRAPRAPGAVPPHFLSIQSCLSIQQTLAKL